MSEVPLHFKTITAVAELIKAKHISPVEVATAILDRIDQLDSRLKSYATVMADHAMGAARKAESEITAGTYRGPLHGIPVAVKDLCFTEGVRTMGGTHALAEHVPDFDSTVVAKLESAGAVLLGSSILQKGRWVATTLDSRFLSTPGTLNDLRVPHPVDLELQQRRGCATGLLAATRAVQSASLPHIAGRWVSNRHGDGLVATAC